MSVVKKYVNRQFSKILTGRLSIQELTFAKEYRGAAGYRPTACVPALELAKYVYVNKFFLVLLKFIFIDLEIRYASFLFIVV